MSSKTEHEYKELHIDITASYKNVDILETYKIELTKEVLKELKTIVDPEEAKEFGLFIAATEENYKQLALKCGVITEENILDVGKITDYYLDNITFK